MPSKSWEVDSGWCRAVAFAADLLAWFTLLGCTGELALAELNTLRHRLPSVPARLTQGGGGCAFARRPWSEALVTANR